MRKEDATFRVANVAPATIEIEVIAFVDLKDGCRSIAASSPD